MNRKESIKFKKDVEKMKKKKTEGQWRQISSLLDIRYPDGIPSQIFGSNIVNISTKIKKQTEYIFKKYCTI